MKSYFYYWQSSIVDEEHGQKLEHSASEQFARVRLGDHVWHVTVRDGKLLVVGRIIVGWIGDKMGAAQKLATDDLLAKSYHIIAADGTAEPVSEICIPDLAASLRFEGSSDRLKISDGQVNVQQIRTMRTLTPNCAADLESAFQKMKAS